MPRPHDKKEETYQAAVRFPQSWVPRLATLGRRMSPLVVLSNAAVLRAVIERGLVVLEAEHDLAPSEEADADAKPPARD